MPTVNYSGTDDMGKIRVEQVGPEIAHSVWSASPHATPFTNPDVLKSFFPGVEWWAVIRGNDLVSAWPVPLDSAGRPTNSGWFYFVGPIWDQKHFPPPAHRWLASCLDVYTGFIEALITRFGKLSASLPPPQTDVRAFTWWKYHDGAPIRVVPCYTAQILDLHTKSWGDVLAGMRQVRRYELRNSSIERINWSAQVNPDELTSLYLERTPGDRSLVVRDMQNLLRLVDEGWGCCTVARDDDGQLASAAVVLSDRRTANVVINSVSEKWKKTGLNAHTVARTIEKAARSGHRAFDFNGANSPQRGDDKHSYGAVPILYFDLELRSTAN